MLLHSHVVRLHVDVASLFTLDARINRLRSLVQLDYIVDGVMPASYSNHARYLAIVLLVHCT